MELQNRNSRIRRLIRKLNRTKRLQGKKINILCNDIISLHKKFAPTLQVLKFVAEFYQGLIGQDELPHLLHFASKNITDSLHDCSVAIFLLESNNFQVHLFDNQNEPDSTGEKIANCFTVDVIKEISDSHNVCLAEGICTMGLQGELEVLSTLCLAAFPLQCDGLRIGALLVYRPAEMPFSESDLEKINAVTTGLGKAIRASQLNMQAQ